MHSTSSVQPLPVSIADINAAALTDVDSLEDARWAHGNIQNDDAPVEYLLFLGPR